MQIGLRQLLLLLAGCVSLAFATHVHFFALSDVLALRGFSILEVLAAHADPQAFARDYPGGARLTTSNSPTVHLYTFGQDYLGLDALVMLYGMILFEICVLTFGLWLLWSAMLDGQLTLTLASFLISVFVLFFLFIASQAKKYFEEQYILSTRSHHLLKQMQLRQDTGSGT